MYGASPYVTAADDDKVAMREFWRFYEPRRHVIAQRVQIAAANSAQWAAVLSRLAPDQAAREDDESHALQAAAILDDRWDPYLASLRAQGERYAAAGVGYAAWFDVIRAYRDGIREQLALVLEADPERNVASVLAVSRGMTCVVDVIVEMIGEAYIATKERLVARGEERYRAMFELSPLPMWTFDRETLAFVAVNDAAIRHYGYSREEFAAMTLVDIRPEEDVGALREDLATHARGFAAAKTWRHRKKDGTIIFVDVRANDFEIDGRPVRLVAVNDVTSRVRAEEALRRTEDQLRQAQKMEAIGRLAGGVAHDFNNVLTVVQSYASMLEDSLDQTDSRHADAAEIRRASERATAITRQLLTLSRHAIAAPRSLDPDELVAGFVPMLRRLVGEQVSLTIHAGKVPLIVADLGQLEQVLMNLAVNARDAMPTGGRLTIETRAITVDADTADRQQIRPGAYVEIAVTDTGTGMDADTRGRIFDPFFTTKEAGKGTGLGLSIVHGIVTQAGGAIAVYSELGRGSTFRVHLPVAEKAVMASQRDTIVAPRNLPPMRVLVVEDQADVRAVAVRILQEAGCSAIEAASAEEARKLVVSHEEPIDLVLLDVVLPDARGDVLIRQLRDLRPSIVFVQMSGYPAGSMTPAGGTPVDLLAKPFSPSELRAAVARARGLTEDAARANLPVTGAATAKRRALVADDDDELRRAIARLLAKAGFEVTDVDSGFKAISSLESTPFDVVISDVHMEDGGGLDLLRAVRRVDLDVPIILITGQPSLQAAAQAVEYGAFRYLTKPLDSAAFVKTAEHAARAHALARLRREAFNVSGAHAGVADRAGLEVRFDHAMQTLWLAFQPIVHARSGALFGIEALMRSEEPSLPSPPAVLDAASQLGRLPIVGRRVRGLSGAAIAARGDDLALFVNLHPDDLLDVDLMDETTPLARIAPRVILEITERAALESSAALTERIARLRTLGFRLAVDDIGAGYSGLMSFTELAPEVVKIDMSLVRDVHKSALKQRTIAALCRLCREVGTLVVGEGVETLEERDMLVELGCDLLQGYLIGRPNRELPG